MKFSSMSILFILALILVSSVSYAGGEPYCSFSSMVTSDDYSFNVTSQPAESCEKQVLRISVLKQAMPFTQFVAPSESIVEKAWAEDLDDDGNFELLILCHNYSEPSKKTIVIYSVDGNMLKQIRLPASDKMAGYRGGDRFIMENGRIVRSYPLYLSGDSDARPTGGEKRIFYQYRNRTLLLVAGQEKIRGNAPSVKESARKKGAQLVKLKSIEVKQDYIEIKADGAIENYKTTRIADPWRLIIDIPGAGSDLQVKELIIDRQGISRVRIGVDKDRVRLVFDSAVSPLPTETITPAENALRVGFFKLLEKNKQ